MRLHFVPKIKARWPQDLLKPANLIEFCEPDEAIKTLTYNAV